MTLDRKPFYQHVTSRADVSTASRPQTLTSSSSSVTAGSAAATGGSWPAASSGRTFPRRGGGAGSGGGTLQAGRRRMADAEPITCRTAVPRSHSRSYGDLHSEDQLTPPLPPPPLLDLPEPRAGGRARTSSPAASGQPRGGSRRGVGCSWTLDRHRSMATPACTNPDITPRDCVVDCRQTGYPVYDM